MRNHIRMSLCLAVVGLCLLAWPALAAPPPHAPLLAIPASVPTSDVAEHDAYHGVEGSHADGADGAHPHPALAFAPAGCETPTAAPTVVGVQPLAPGGVFCTGISFNGEIDLWERDGRHFVVQAGASQAAFVITEVTNPQAPRVVKLFTWQGDYGIPSTAIYAASVRFFAQAGRDYLALSVERMTGGQVAGVFLIDVTVPEQPVVLWHLTGDVTGQPADGKRWYDVHNVFVETIDGMGAYLWLTNDNNRDVRVLDIRGLAALSPGQVGGWMGREVGRWSHPDGFNAVGFLHDITVVRGRAYVAHWLAGLVILPSEALHQGVYTGSAATALALHPLHAMDPLLPPGPGNRASFEAHHAFPTRDGRWVFVQDESSTGPGGHVLLWDLRGLPQVPSAPSAVLELPTASRTHNLLIENGRLYVGWYGDGLRAYDLDLDHANGPRITPTLVHSLRAAPQTGYDGAWGVRLGPCGGAGALGRCLYTSDMEYGLMIDRELLAPPCLEADLNCDGRINVVDVQRVAAAWPPAVPYQPVADHDADGDVDVRDILLVAQAWHREETASMARPEG